jgi:hypothetical protein
MGIRETKQGVGLVGDNWLAIKANKENIISLVLLSF